MDSYAGGADEPARPAVVFVHGGPVPEGNHPEPRDWHGFVGYATVAARAGLVGLTFNHPLGLWFFSGGVLAASWLRQAGAGAAAGLGWVTVRVSTSHTRAHGFEEHGPAPRTTARCTG